MYRNNKFESVKVNLENESAIVLFVLRRQIHTG